MDIKSIHQPFSMVSKTMTEQKENTKKTYRYTKQLIKLAIENGYTNQEIAVKSGLSSKSIAVVSRWRNGKALATERQMIFFIKEFEHLLKRKMEHLFYSQTENPYEFIYHKIEGEILLTHTLNYRNSRSKPIEKVGVCKFVILNLGSVFHLLEQKKVGLDDDGSNVDKLLKNKKISNNEQANWYLVKTHKNLSPQELVDTIDSIVNTFCHSENKLARNIRNDALYLKYIIRQLLLKNGYAINDIVDL